jgi:hypothetical protein
VLLTRIISRPSLEAALSYARGLGWAVVPGCDQGSKGRRCGRADCLSAPPHPAGDQLDQPASSDETTIRRWWRRAPQAPVLLPTGLRFDVLDIPADAADAALERVWMTGYKLGPVARTVSGRLLLWVRPGARLPAELHRRQPWPYAAEGLHCHSGGEFVLAPPSNGTTWVRPPSEYTQPTLPHCADILPGLVHACR